MGTTLAPGRLGAAAVTFFALAATAPIVVLTTVVPAAYATGGGPLVPLSFLAIGLVGLLFAPGYAALARRAPFAGALYAYLARGLGRPAGVGAAWLALACYQAIQLGLYSLVGAAAAPLLSSWFRVDAEWWTVAAGCWLLVALGGTIRAEVSGGLIALLVLAEAAVAVGFAAANVLDPAGGVFTADSIVPAGVDRPALGLLLAVGLLAFAGFETPGAYAEEAIRPRRDPGLAGYATVVVLAVLLAGVSWSLSVAAGADRITELARGRGPELFFDLAAARLAPWAVTLGRLILLTGLVAAILALHHVMARYLFALGRERVLPAAFGRTSRRTAAPRTASLTLSAVTAGWLAAAVLTGTPLLTGRRLMIAGGLGILVLLVATSVAALLHLNRVPNGEGVWTRFVAPTLATVALGLLGYLAFRDIEVLFGTDWHRALWIVPAAIGGVVAIGVLHAMVLRAARPVVYAGIGQGGVPVVVTPPLPRPRNPAAAGGPGPAGERGAAAGPGPAGERGAAAGPGPAPDAGIAGGSGAAPLGGSGASPGGSGASPGGSGAAPPGGSGATEAKEKGPPREPGAHRPERVKR